MQKYLCFCSNINILLLIKLILFLFLPGENLYTFSLDLDSNTLGESCPSGHLQQDEHLHGGDGEAGHQGGQGEPGGGQGFQVGYLDDQKFGYLVVVRVSRSDIWMFKYLDIWWW